MTTYGDLITCFKENCGIDLEQINDMSGMIHNSIRHYNNKMGTSLKWDDITETLSDELDDSHLLILAFCMKLSHQINDLEGFQDLWMPFEKELGFSNYNGQVKGRENTIQRTNHYIIELITNIEDKSIM